MGQQHPLPKQETGEVYTTGNVLIRRIGERLTRKIGEMLRDIGATERFGLDIGCAEGHLLADLKRQGVIGEVVAVELEFEKITSSVAGGTGVRFVQGDAENIGVRSETFDYVMATEVLEHLPHPEKALAEITLSEPIVMALNHNSGLYGSYLQLARAVEQRDFDNLDFLASALGIQGWRVSSVPLAALAWVEELGI